MGTPSGESAKTRTVWGEEVVSHSVALRFLLTSRIHFIVIVLLGYQKVHFTSVTHFIHFWKSALYCPPCTATIRHESFTSGHLCCNIKSLPHQLRIDPKLHKNTKHADNDREQSLYGYNITATGLNEHFFFICSAVKFVFLWLHFFTDLGTACQLYWISSCHSSIQGCCTSEFWIKHGERREQLQYMPYGENENISKEIKKSRSKIKIAVTTIEIVWGKMGTTFQQNCTHSCSQTRKKLLLCLVGY